MIPDDVIRANRREFLGHGVFGHGSLALGSLALTQMVAAESNSTLAPSSPGSALPAGGQGSLPAGGQGLHFPAKAKRVIYLFQSGAPSQLDLFDHKPLLNEKHGTELPDSVRMGQRLTGMSGNQSSLPLAG